MAEKQTPMLKDIKDVPLLPSLDGSEQMLLNVDGRAKQAQIMSIKSLFAEKRELVYDWNPGIDENGEPITDIYEIDMNVEDDISWITEPTTEVGYEIEIELYCCIYDPDLDDVVPIPEVIMKSDMRTFRPTYITNYPLERTSAIHGWFEGDGFVLNGPTNCVSVRVGAANHVNYDSDEGEPVFMENGGNIYLFVDNDNPFKSIRIYRVTK